MIVWDHSKGQTRWLKAFLPFFSYTFAHQQHMHLRCVRFSTGWTQKGILFLRWTADCVVHVRPGQAVPLQAFRSAERYATRFTFHHFLSWITNENKNSATLKRVTKKLNQKSEEKEILHNATHQRGNAHEFSTVSQSETADCIAVNENENSAFVQQTAREYRQGTNTQKMVRLVTLPRIGDVSLSPCCHFDGFPCDQQTCNTKFRTDTHTIIATDKSSWDKALQHLRLPFLEDVSDLFSRVLFNIFKTVLFSFPWDIRLHTAKTENNSIQESCSWPTIN